MIDRKTLWLLVLLIAAMTAASVWRLSLLPDWTQLTLPGRNGPHIKHSFVLFVPPLSLIFMIVLMKGMRWFFPGPEDAVRAHARRTRLAVLGTSATTALMHAFMIARSLGHGSEVDGEALSRTATAGGAILIIITGNSMPKLPWISSRLPLFQLDPWQQARSRRFAGWLTIGLGVAMFATAALAPIRAVSPLILVLCTAYSGAIFWNAMRLKRGPSAIP